EEIFPDIFFGGADVSPFVVFPNHAVLLYLLLKLFIKLAVNLHAVDRNGILDVRFKRIGIHVCVSCWTRRWLRFLRWYISSRWVKFDHFVIVEFLLEVFAVSKEIEELEFLLLFDVLLNLTAFLLDESKRVFSGPATLDLDKVGRRENRPQQDNVEQILAIVSS